MKRHLKKLNWRSVGAAFFSFLSMLSVASYQLGDVAIIVPPKWKANLFIVSASAAFLLRVWNSIKQPLAP